MSDFTTNMVAICRLFGVAERDQICCGTVTIPQCVVLQELLEGPRTIGELADGSGSSQSAMTRLVDGLERSDWVERVRSAEDRRRVDVSLTVAGGAEAERLRALTVQSMECILAAVPEDKRAQVVESTAVLRQAIAKIRRNWSCC